MVQASLALIVYMVVAKFSNSVPDLRGGDAAALVGDIAALTVFLASLAGDGKGFLESSAEHVVHGLVFAFKAMGVVLPIAGFFFIGNGDFSGQILGTAGSAGNTAGAGRASPNCSVATTALRGGSPVDQRHPGIRNALMSVLPRQCLRHDLSRCTGRPAPA